MLRRVLALIVAISLLAVGMPRAEAAYSEENAVRALNRQLGLRILRGHGFDPRESLPDPITRAELIVLIVRTFGREDDAKLLQGAPVFPDTANHWASGYIAVATQMAANHGSTIGMPDAAFHPDDKVSPAQIIAFTMKFLGVRPMPLKAWPSDYLDVAADQLMLDPADIGWITAEANRPATRGEAFYLMDWIFYHYDVGAGKTVYTKYVDPVPPTLTLADEIPVDLPSGKVTISGQALGATELFVSNTPVPIDADGTFTYEYDLSGEREYHIVITARDPAGNTVEKSISMTRTQGN
jgi:hypothetical protein